MTGDFNLHAVEQLEPGEHLHLDEIIDSPPHPGAPAWLPIAEQVAKSLEVIGGRWAVAVPLGQVEAPPTELGALEEFLEIPRTLPELEPPSVARLSPGPPSAQWSGESFAWQQVQNKTLLKVMHVFRSDIDKQAGEPFSTSLIYQIWSV